MFGGDLNLNTSYVTLQQGIPTSSLMDSANLNTSYVTLQHLHQLGFYLVLLFKYIICYSSTAIHKLEIEGNHPFKYIICYSSTSNNRF